MTSGGCAGPTERQLSNAMLSVYLDGKRFESDDFFAREVRQYVEFVKSARPADPSGEVLVPGEPERRTRAKRLAEGVPLPEEAWQAILEASRSTGLSQEQIDRALSEEGGPPMEL